MNCKCGSSPIYGKRDQPAVACLRCRSYDMSNDLCTIHCCDKVAINKNPFRCSKHTDKGKDTICQVCGKLATYGYEYKSVVYCEEHKAEDQFSGVCVFKGCVNLACYGTDKPTHCFHHAKKGEKIKYFYQTDTESIFAEVTLKKCKIINCNNNTFTTYCGMHDKYE